MARLIIWPAAMAYVGLLIAGKGSIASFGVTVSGALMGAGTGSILAIMFAGRALRKRKTAGLTRS
jgi:hypothetical protein